MPRGPYHADRRDPSTLCRAVKSACYDCGRASNGTMLCDECYEKTRPFDRARREPAPVGFQVTTGERGPKA